MNERHDQAAVVEERDMLAIELHTAKELLEKAHGLLRRAAPSQEAISLAVEIEVFIKLEPRAPR